MYALASIKFRDVALRQSLLDTGQSPLMECVKSREGYWSGLTYTAQPGRNILGETLMQQRQFIRNQSSRNMPGQVPRVN